MGVAERVATEQGCVLGEDVGYQVRRCLLKDTILLHYRYMYMAPDWS